MTRAAARTRADTGAHPSRAAARSALGRLHMSGVFWYRLHAMMLATFPEAGIALVTGFFTVVFWACAPRIRRAVRANLRAACGPAGWWTEQARVMRLFWTFGWCFTERAEHYQGRRRFRFEMENLETWRRLHDRSVRDGRGFLMVTAHIGHWEVGSALPVTGQQRTVHIVREREPSEELQEFTERLIGERLGPGYVTHFAGDDPSLGLELYEAVRDGGIVALQGDRPRTGGQVHEARLFGRPFPLPVGPAVLARTAEVPLVPVYVYRVGRRRYRVVVHDPIHPARTGDRSADVADALDRLAARLEAAIRRDPEQWFYFAPAFPTD